MARIKEHLRPYDLITRLGGDEFLCAISNMTLPDARRLHKVAAALAARRVVAMSTAFAELTPAERTRRNVRSPITN